MGRVWWLAGGISGFLAVAAGAFGAHGLEERVAPDLLAVFETGARYHLVHALALCAVASLASRAPAGAVRVAGWSFLAGTVLFSGSLYALVLTGIRSLGAVTPFGGVALLAGWAALAVAGWRSRPGE